MDLNIGVRSVRPSVGRSVGPVVHMKHLDPFRTDLR
jgi:hypothetical protein